MPTKVTETANPATLAEAVAPTGTGRFLIQLIDAGWGTSGHYSAEVLEQAARDRVFGAGTQMFTDHPTPTEDYERPARSVKDLAAVLVEDARYDPQARALVAEARVYGPWRAPLSEMAGDIGVSIRAIAEGDAGQVEGRTGFVVDRLVEGLSVDFVTKAGRGGRVLEVLEGAKAVAEARNIGQWVEARLHANFTAIADDLFGDGRLTREERIALSASIGDALGAFVGRLEQAAPALYTRDLWDQAPTPAPAVAEQSVPAHPAGQSTTTTLESKEDTMPKIEIDEARLAALEADAGRVSALETERDAALARATAAEARLTNRPIIAAVLGESASIPATVQGAVVEAVLTALPAGADEPAVKAAAEAARQAKETEIAAILEHAGTGAVRGLGATHPASADVTEALDKAVARTFGHTIKEA